MRDEGLGIGEGYRDAGDASGEVATLGANARALQQKADVSARVAKADRRTAWMSEAPTGRRGVLRGDEESIARDPTLSALHETAQAAAL